MIARLINHLDARFKSEVIEDCAKPVDGLRRYWFWCSIGPGPLLPSLRTSARSVVISNLRSANFTGALNLIDQVEPNFCNKSSYNLSFLALEFFRLTQPEGSKVLTAQVWLLRT
jgi:hypothetical protein